MHRFNSNRVDQTQYVVHQITEYLSGGGLFNPELADHDSVRDLLITIRDLLMNNTIKSLAIESNLITEEQNGFDRSRLSNSETKFAELIVKYCLSNMENCDGDLDYAIWKTKKDFGI